MLSYSYLLQEGIVGKTLKFMTKPIPFLASMAAYTAAGNASNIYSGINNMNKDANERNTGLIDSSRYSRNLQDTIEKHNQFMSKYGGSMTPEAKSQFVQKFQGIQNQINNGENIDYNALNKNLGDLGSFYDKHIGNNSGSFFSGWF